MYPQSQVLLRQPELFSGPLLLAGLPPDALLDELPQAIGWSWHAGDYRWLNTTYPQRNHFGIQAPSAPWEAAVLFLPKSRELTEYLVQLLAHQLAGKLLYLVGEKRAGIERAAKQLSNFGQPRKLDSARHCQLWQLRVTSAPEPVLAPHAFSVALPQGELSVRSLPGVFSHGRLDVGTALLLQHLEGLPQGDWLDYGCGAGVLGAALKHSYPSTPLHLLDVDAFALESSRLTLAANQLTAEVIAGDSLAEAPHDLAAIITNPPFHQGVHTDYQATERLIQEAKQHLKSGGVLRLVANSFLRYPELIEQHLGPCRILAEQQGFRVYEAHRP